MNRFGCFWRAPIWGEQRYSKRARHFRCLVGSEIKLQHLWRPAFEYRGPSRVLFWREITHAALVRLAQVVMDKHIALC